MNLNFLNLNFLNVMRKTALITGVTGQDGYYLSRLLLGKGYRVVGLIPPARKSSIAKLGQLAEQIETYIVDLTNADWLTEAVEQLQPTEIYNLAAPSFVPRSWEDPLGTLDLVTGTATRLLKATRQLGLSTRFYQASSSEIFWRCAECATDGRDHVSAQKPIRRGQTTCPLDDGASSRSLQLICL